MSKSKSSGQKISPKLAMRPAIVWAVGVFTAVFALYAITIYPAFPPGHDSAELIAVAASGGIAHPPGYPLYTVLGHSLCSISPWEPVVTMNLLATFFGAVAVGVLALTLSLATDSLLAGCGAAVTLALATTPWRLSVGAEVFSLHLAFLAGLLLLAILWRMYPAKREFTLSSMAGLFGLACAHHQTVVLLLPPLIFFMWWVKRSEQGTIWGWSWKAVPIFILGLVPYLYLPWRASQAPLLNWGDPSTLERFFWVVSRSGYGGLQLSSASATQNNALYHLGHWLTSLGWKQFPLVGALLGLCGASWTWSQRREQLFLWGGLCLLAGPLWALIAQQPSGDGYVDMLERFYASSYLGFAGLIAWGFVALQERLNGRARYVGVGALVLAVVLGMFLNFSRAACCHSSIVAESVASMFKTVSDGSTVITCNDLTSGAFMYATAVEGRKLCHLPLGLLHSEWFLAGLDQEQVAAIKQGGVQKLLLSERRQGREVYCEAIPPGVTQGFFLPCGLMYRYLAPGEPIPDRTQASIASLLILEETERAPQVNFDDRPFWEVYYAKRWQEAYANLVEGLPKGSKMCQIAEEKAQ